MKTAIAIFAIAGAVLCAPPGMGDFNIQAGQAGLPNMGPPGDHHGSHDMHDFTIQGGPDGHHGGVFGPHGPPPPPYLANVTDEARQEYFTIVSNMNNTIAQQKQSILAWAQKHGLEAQVQAFNTNMTTLVTQMKQNMTLLINSLPSALQQILSIAGNETLTPVQMREAMRQLTSQNPQVYHIIKLATAHLHPKELGLPAGPQNFVAGLMKAPEGQRAEDGNEAGNEQSMMVMDTKDEAEDDENN